MTRFKQRLGFQFQVASFLEQGRGLLLERFFGIEAVARFVQLQVLTLEPVFYEQQIYRKAASLFVSGVGVP